MALKVKAICPEIIGKTKKGTDSKSSLPLCFFLFISSYDAETAMPIAASPPISRRAYIISTIMQRIPMN